MPDGSTEFCTSNNNLRQIPDVKAGLETNGTDGVLSTSPQTFSGELSRHLHSRVRFRSALDDPRLHTIGAVAYLMIRDRPQHHIGLPNAPLGADSAGPKPERIQRLSGSLQAQLSR